MRRPKLGLVLANPGGAAHLCPLAGVGRAWSTQRRYHQQTPKTRLVSVGRGRAAGWQRGASGRATVLGGDAVLSLMGLLEAPSELGQDVGLLWKGPCIHRCNSPGGWAPV